MKKLASFVLTGLVIVMGANPAQAQERVIEFGIDGGFVLTSPSVDGADNTFDVTLPFQQLRVGFLVNDQISIEPSLSFDRQDFGGDFTVTQLGLQGNGLYHLSTDRTQRQFYLQAGGGLQYLSVDDQSATQWLVGAGAGVKVPLQDRLAGRFAVLYQRAFETDDFFAANVIRGQVGLSFLTH